MVVKMYTAILPCQLLPPRNSNNYFSVISMMQWKWWYVAQTCITLCVFFHRVQWNSLRFCLRSPVSWGVKTKRSSFPLCSADCCCNPTMRGEPEVHHVFRCREREWRGVGVRGERQREIHCQQCSQKPLHHVHLDRAEDLIKWPV